MRGCGGRHRRMKKTNTFVVRLNSLAMPNCTGGGCALLLLIGLSRASTTSRTCRLIGGHGLVMPRHALPYSVQSTSLAWHGGIYRTISAQRQMLRQIMQLGFGSQDTNETQEGRYA
jgi:hypothetical protein